MKCFFSQRGSESSLVRKARLRTLYHTGHARKHRHTHARRLFERDMRLKSFTHRRSAAGVCDENEHDFYHPLANKHRRDLSPTRKQTPPYCSCHEGTKIVQRGRAVLW